MNKESKQIHIWTFFCQVFERRELPVPSRKNTWGLALSLPHPILQRQHISSMENVCCHKNSLSFYNMKCKCTHAIDHQNLFQASQLSPISRKGKGVEEEEAAPATWEHYWAADKGSTSQVPPSSVTALLLMGEAHSWGRREVNSSAWTLAEATEFIFNN